MDRITTKDIVSRLAELNKELPLPVGWSIARNGAYGRTSIDLEYNYCTYAQFANGTKRECYDVLFGAIDERAVYRAWSDAAQKETTPHHDEVKISQDDNADDAYTVTAFGCTRKGLSRWRIGSFVYGAWKLSQV